MKVGQYIGARYLGKEPLIFGGANGGLSFGCVCTSIPEHIAIQMEYFEPVYTEPIVKEFEGNSKNKKYEVLK